MNIPNPIFKKDLNKISWKKIYDREYGVQYSEVAVSLLAFASYHFPETSVTQVVIPGEGSNTAFYIDDIAWIKLVEGLNQKYTSNVGNLEKYEKQFELDGKNYLETAKKISKLNLKDLTDKELLKVFLDHQDKRYKKEENKQEIIDALFKPKKQAAVLELQYQVEKHNGKLTEKEFDSLYERFKWLSCLDIQNRPWTKQEFREHIKSFTQASGKEGIPFKKIIQQLKPKKEDLEYLLMAKRFVYIKDARDDFRRESVFYANNLWEELGRRMGLESEDTSYLQDQEIISFLTGKGNISKGDILQRKKGFILYIGDNKKLVCLQGEQIRQALRLLNLLNDREKIQNISGRVASKGLAKGKVVIVKGVKDLGKVEVGDVLIAVTTHPDYVPAMRKAVAIVTDEGGITSHAAIVSREFGIPCIVGSQLATRVFKDGDLVEVDANVGVVKKI